MDTRKTEGMRLEGLVAADLERRGFRIVARNYRKPWGEIDIVALKDRQLVVCEVRSRSNASTTDAAETVRATKRGRIRMTTDSYLEECPFRYDEVRFFVAGVSTVDGVVTIQLFEDAF